MKGFRVALATVGAIVALAAIAGSAGASTLSAGEGSFRITWSRLNFSGGFGLYECESSLEGAFHSRSFAKTAGSLVGYITEANITRCTRGGVTFLRETLPWHVQYNSFAGTLPSITAIRTNVIGYAGRIREPTFGLTCLFQSTATQPAIASYNLDAAGRVTSVAASGRIRTSCGNETELSGSGTASSQTVTLI